MGRSLILAGMGLVFSIAAVAQAQDAPPAADRHRMQAPRTRTDVEARVRAQFAELDTNKDGVLTQDELRPHRPTDAERQAMRDKMFAAMDKDGNGQIDKAEFDAFHADRMRRDRGPGPDKTTDSRPGMDRPGLRRMHDWHGMMARMMFARAAAGRGGKLTLADAEKVALDRFDTADTNHDGLLSDAERDAARQQMAARFRERRAHWGEHKGDTPPPPATPQG